MTSHLKFQMRASSILFLLFALMGVYLDWLTFQLPGVSLAPFSHYPVLSAVSALLVILGFLALIGQFRHQRHLFGWIGICFTLCGICLVHLSLFVFTTFFAFSQSIYPSISNVIIYGTFATTLGLLLWAMDLPNFTGVIRLQKGVMVLLAFSPVFPFTLAMIGDAFNLPSIATLLTVNLPNLLVINDMFSFVGWVLLGISVWFHQEYIPVPLEPVISNTDALFELSVSSIPPTKHS